MGLLNRLKALLGLETERREPVRRENVDVTIERTPERPASPDVDTEAAVKGVEEEPPAEPEPRLEPEPEPEPEPELEPESTAEEPEPEPEPETEPEERVPLEELKGIGPSYARRLSEAGVDHVGALAGADAEDLADRTDISAKRIDRWIDRANER